MPPALALFHPTLFLLGFTPLSVSGLCPPPLVFPSIRMFSNESILHIFSNIKTNNVLLDKEREGGDFTMNHNDDNEQPR